MKVKRHVKADKCAEAARIFKEAFSSKLKGILGTDKQIEEVILQALNRREVLVVYAADKRVIGVAAYQYNKRISLAISLKILLNVYGFFQGIYKMFLLAKYFPNKARAGMLYLDAVAVDQAYRGQGVGKLLLAELEKLAKEKQLSCLGLDVIEENHQAKKLYELEGYREDYYKELGKGARKVLGFKGYYHMIKRL